MYAVIRTIKELHKTDVVMN